MQRLSEVCEAIAATTKKTEKVRLLADYFHSRTLDESVASAVFLSGRAFPAWEETTLGVGGMLLWRLIAESSGVGEAALTAAYRRHGDLGAAAFDVMTSPTRRSTSVLASPNVIEVADVFRAVAGARGVAAKSDLLKELLVRVSPLEAKYVVKIITGELRIGLKESLVEEAIAAAYDAQPSEVQRANMLLGDVGETLRLAASHRLGEARMRLLHPIGFMLASPVETSEEAFDFFQHAVIEDKYDGIRAQAHVSGDHVRLFSRTFDDVTGAFPELVDPLLALPDGLIIDGEVLAWDFAAGRALPFADLQTRLGRKRVTEAMRRETPVAYMVFDVLYADGELVIDRPLHERAKLVDGIFEQATASPRSAVTTGTRLQAQDSQGLLQFEPAVIEEQISSAPSAVIRAPQVRADSAEHLDRLFEQAQSRGNEGLMIKNVNSTYTPGRRGRAWLKLKRELATLDVVVTSVEWGHGKRANVLSDVTFAVIGHTGLLNIGKAYSGLTDREIDDLTRWFLEHTVADHGFWREVEPKLVLEVAFNAVMQSDRHNSGYALRFPRILRIRTDKTPDEIDTIETVAQIYNRQHRPRKHSAGSARDSAA